MIFALLIKVVRFLFLPSSFLFSYPSPAHNTHSAFVFSSNLLDGLTDRKVPSHCALNYLPKTNSVHA